MQNPCQDSYYTLFSSYPMLLNYHEEQAKNSRWIRCKVADLQVEPLGKSSPLIGNLPAFAAGTSQEAVDDTAENLGLAMRVNGELYPIRMTAYKSLLDRAKIGGTALPKLSREVLAEVLNECLKLYSADALLLIRDEKISAVHSGDEVDYSVLPIDELLKVLQAKLDARFSGNEFESGYCDHSLVSASWRMDNDAMWSHQAVIRIIRDYKYTGAMVSFKCGNETIRAKVQKRYAPEDYVINEGMHEPIVTHDEYYAANDTLRKVKKYDVVRTDRRDRVYYCGHCGRRLRKTFGLDEYYSCATPLYIRDAPCAGIHWSRTNIEDVVFTTYKRQLQIVSEEYCRTVNEKQPDKLAPLRAQQKSLRIQLGGIGGKVASLYEQFRSDEISRNAFLEKKGALSEDRDRLQTELSRIEDEIEGLLQKQEESNTAMNAIKNIAAAADEPDDKLRERMYDDIDRVIVFDNENLKIEWKFDVAFQLS